MDEQWMRSSLHRAQGLGSAREGVAHWWMQRVTAIALIPLTLWFAALLIALSGSDYNAVIAWLRTPFVTILMVLLLIMLCQHVALGIQVVIEDYVHSDRVKIPAVVAIRYASFGIAVAGIIATLHIAFAAEALS
jgi:succinate dehydrogenase / fumarate reductase, membrane anchor subunit